MGRPRKYPRPEDEGYEVTEDGEIVSPDLPPGIEGVDDLSQEFVPREERSTISNPNEAPLFGDWSSGKNARSVEKIRVTRVTPPGEGVKGYIPRSVDENYIHEKWGNGTYRVEAVNKYGRVMTAREIPINFGDLNPQTPPLALQADAGKSDFAKEMLLSAQRAHEAEVARSRELANQSVDQVREQGKQFTALLHTTHQTQAQRDREFYQTQSQNNQSFFASLMQQSQIMHQQTMAQQQEQFRQTIMMMQTANQAALQANNPVALLSIFKQGMEMGRDMEPGPEEEEPWLKAIGMGVDGLKSLATLKTMEMPMRQAAMARRKVLQRPNPGAPPAKNLPKAAPPVEADEEELLDPKEKAELEDFVELCDRKGVDFQALLKQAKEQVGSLPDAPDAPEGEEEEDEGEGVDEETKTGEASTNGSAVDDSGSPDVARRGPQDGKPAN